MQTEKPMYGTWTLTAPDGRTWSAESPLKCCALEQHERVPSEVALARVMDACAEHHVGYLKSVEGSAFPLWDETVVAVQKRLTTAHCLPYSNTTAARRAATNRRAA